MNQPKVRMWAKFVLSPKSGKTPKYVLTDACGWVDELKDLVGRDGYISLYLQQTYQGNYQKPLKIKTHFLLMLINMALMRVEIA